MDFTYYSKHINKNTVGRYDLTPLFEDPVVFSHLLTDLLLPFNDVSFDKIVGLDALGFVIGGALAQKAGVGFVCIRKGGKLPGVKGTVLRTSSFTDYSNSEKSFEINMSSISKGDKVLLIDEWIETGTQMKAAVKLIEELGGEIIGISCLGCDKTDDTKELLQKYPVKAITFF